MPAIRQPSFAGGELSPSLWGRTDLAKYSTGLRRARNFFISTHGSAVSRPGTTYIRRSALNTRVRLIPFYAPEGTAYVLEVGHLYIRLHIDGDTVMTQPGGSTPYQITTPWRQEHVSRLKYAQTGDILTVTHPNYPPQELMHRGLRDWVLQAISFDVPKYRPEGTAPMAQTPLPVADAEHPAREWQYQVTLVTVDEQGFKRESAPYPVTQTTTGGSRPPSSNGTIPAKLAIYPDRPLTLNFLAPQGLGSGAGVRQLETRFYRGRGGKFGFIGRVEGPQSSTGTFIDAGDEPDYFRPPPAGRNPFKVFDSDDDATLLRTEHPVACAYFEQRQILAGTMQRPGTFWASAVNDYLNFDDPIPAPADAAVELTLASRKREEIRAIIGLEKLIVFTDASVWAVGGPNGAALSRSDAPEVRVQSETGCSHLDPLVVDETVIYARNKGAGVRALAYDDSRRAYGGADLSILAQHLFDGHAIVDWTYAADPWGIVWAVRDDGKLLSFTYSQEQEIWAWALHETDGFVEAVCSVPEGVEDAVYLVVRRIRPNGQENRLIERMATRLVTSAAAAVCLDSTFTFRSQTGTTNVTGLHPYLQGKEVWAVADGEVVGPFTPAGTTLTLLKPARLVHVGFRYECELELLDLAQATPRPIVVKRVILEVEASRGLWTGTSKGLWAGEDGASLNEWRQRVVADDSDAMPLYTGKVDIGIRSAWNNHGRVTLKQVDPLPVTVLSATREGEVGG